MQAPAKLLSQRHGWVNKQEDRELGIDRSQVEPVKFVSTTDCKPVYPPYLQLADLESYIE